jgi:hypothetical protein
MIKIWRILIYFYFSKVILVFSVLNNEHMLGEEYKYPDWAIPLGRKSVNFHISVLTIFEFSRLGFNGFICDVHSTVYDLQVW